MLEKNSTRKDPLHDVVHSVAADVSVPWDQVDKVRFAAAGLTFGIVEGAITHPLETLKINLQASRSGVASWKSIYRAGGGMKGLYRGFVANSILPAPSNFFYLHMYNVVKTRGFRYCEDHGVTGWKADILVPLVSGAVADMSSHSLANPADVIATHMMRTEGKGQYRGNLPTVIRSIYRTEGIRGFYRGFVAAAITYTPLSAIWWPAYEFNKQWLSPYILSDEVRASGGDGIGSQASRQLAILVLTSGLFAGAVAYSVTNPLDVIRTRIVLQQGHGETRFFSVMFAIIRKEGFRALLRGVGTRVLSTAPSAAIASFSYELAVRLSIKQ
jgi:solute carrier family 25, member 44